MKGTAVSRRDVLRFGLAAGAALPLGLGVADGEETPKTSPPPGYLDAAVKAARWIRTNRVATRDGYIWLTGPERPEGLDTAPDIYRGSAGIGFTLFRVHKETRKGVYRQAALRCRDLIHAAAEPAGAGVQWGDYTDIIGGGAGTGLYLLYMARNTDDAASRDLAAKAGLRLIELGIPEAGGLKWVHAEHRVNPNYTYAQTGYMQGAAGIGMALLHMDAVEKGKEWTFRLPDSPYEEPTVRAS